MPRPFKLQMLKPRIKELEPRIKTLSTRKPRTLKDKQHANGRTLALDGVAWRKLRALVLSEEPTCRHCQALGRVTPATDVDHINDDPSDNSRENLQALCRECHSRKTNADMGRRVAYGCGLDGMPLDPNHPWNLEKSPATEGHKPAGPPRANANRENEP